MPNYEPTPRRFSTLYVPRSASRRNSVNGATDLGPVSGPAAHDRPPVDLADALQHLQHVELETERGRGRTKRSGEDIARRTILGHNGIQVTAPPARRENSASTWERIVEWEARSRSQSKSRSKSRSRDMGSKHRISVVPEIPDLALSLSAFEQQEAVSGRQAKDAGQSNIEKNVNDNTEKGRAERPHTPASQTQERPPTPDTTPKPSSSIPSGDADVETSNVYYQVSAGGKSLEGVGISNYSKAPATPPPKAGSKGVLDMGLPLTPQATPERSKNTLRQGNEDSYSPSEAKYSRPTNNLEFLAARQPGNSKHQVPVEGEPSTQSHAHYHLPSDLLSEESQDREQRGRHTATPGTSLRDVDKPDRQTMPGAEMEPMYHNVWRINPYEPEFPLPDRPETYVDVQTLSQARFDGNPLQQLPRGRLPTNARNFESGELGVYPCPHPNGSSGGDWAMNIPPSPSRAYVYEDQRARRPQSRSRATEQYIARREIQRHEWDTPSVMERAFHAASVSMIQGLNVPVEVYRGLRNIYYPAPDRPDIVKAYPIRQRLPIRIFFPSHHDLTSPALLPTLLTIHGGAFTVGTPADDDPWNRSFADSYTVLVIALNYAKAPWAAFPAPLLDVEALYHAILNDESLPIDRMRVALAGFDSGANLALALSQLPSVRSGTDPNPPPSPPNHDPNVHPPPRRSNPPPTAVISITGILDFTTPPHQKLHTRPYKPSLRGPRGWGPALDWMARLLLPSGAWSYIPYGHDAADALVSPAWSARADLPPHVFVVAAELDCLAMESWVAACRWGGRVVPGVGERVGREGVGVWRGCLDDGRAGDGGRFGWCEDLGQGLGVQGGSTRWLLVPDVVHGFDLVAWRNKYLWGDEVARMDAEMKTVAYQREMAEWLWEVVWR